MIKKPPDNRGDIEELTFVHDTMPRFTRRRAGRGFCYYDTSGTRIVDSSVIARLRKLVIPPAWTQVWICPDQSGHIQAVPTLACSRLKSVCSSTSFDIDRRLAETEMLS